MRRSTRTSSARCGRSRVYSLSIATALGLVVLLAPRSWAIPVQTEVHLHVTEEAPAVQDAVRQAMRRAVETVVSRHVAARERGASAKAIRSVLERPQAYVLRYSILEETRTPGGLRLVLDADVDEARLFADLRGQGTVLSLLSSLPRVLVVPVGGHDPAVAAGRVQSVLQSQGVRARLLPSDSASELGPGDLALWARDLGCHIALAITAVDGDGPSDASPETNATAGELAVPGLSGSPQMVKATQEFAASLVDARTAVVLGEASVREEGVAETLVQARRRVIDSVARTLSYRVLEVLHQSGWVPGETDAELRVRVAGITDPRLLQEIGDSLRGLTEVRALGLSELSYQSATWTMAVVDSGLAWDAILGSALLPRGRLVWGSADAAAGTGSATGDVVPVAWEP